MRPISLLLLAACFGGGDPLPDLNPVELGPNTKRIQGAGAMLRPDWEHSRWARMGDRLDVAMVLFVVANDGSACIVPDAIWAVATYGDAVRCQGKWRMPR